MATLKAKAPFQPTSELSGGGPVVILDGTGTALVCINDSSPATVEVDVAVFVGGRMTALIVVRNAAALLD